MWHPDEFQFIPGVTPLTSFNFLIIISIIHLLITFTLEKFMKNKTKPIINIRNIQRYNNLLIGLYSLITFVLINILAYRDNRFSSWDRLICQRTTPSGFYMFVWYIFYLSKLWEFIDIYLVILNKTPILIHFRWHHQTTPSVVLIGLLGDISYEWPMIISNTLLHTFMYPHFAGIWNSYPIIIILGAFQLIVGLTFNFYALLFNCHGSFYAKIFGLFIYITYTIGFIYEHFYLIYRFKPFIMSFRKNKKN